MLTTIICNNCVCEIAAEQDSQRIGTFREISEGEERREKNE